MPTQERLWTNKELDNLLSTIDTLRRLRSATTLGMEPFPSGIMGTWGRWRHPERFQEPADRHNVLLDAEDLGIKAGNFLAERLAKDTRDPAKFESWNETLERTRESYKGYEALTFAATGNLEVPGSIITHMRALHSDPEYMLKFDLLHHNYLGAGNIEGLVQKRLTIVAPLSGDFLLAAVYRAYLEQTRGRTFHLKAAALSRNLQGVVIPNDELMEENPEIAIFLDVTETGETARALLSALNSSYPDKVIHEPGIEGMRERYLGFKPSKKMIRKLGADYFGE